MAELKMVFIALVVFAGIVTGTLAFAGSVFDTYNSDIENSEEFERFQTLSNEVDNKTQDKLREQRNETFQIGGEIASNVFLVKSVFDGMFTVAESLFVLPSIVSAFIGFTRLPGWLESMVNAIVWIVVMFAIWGIIQGGRSV